MVFFNHATRQMTAKIVYYGPGLCGKTTNLNTIYGKTSQKARGEMVSLNTETDRTLFFDLLPLDVGVIGGFKTKLQLYTVPGQVFYNSTRKLVLKGVDGIVFVVDSQVPMLDANKESLQNLEANLKELGLRIRDIPMVFQWNKRDLKNIVPIEGLERELNVDAHPSFSSNAQEGSGVFETLRGITKLALMHIKSHHFGETTPAREEEKPPVARCDLRGAQRRLARSLSADPGQASGLFRSALRERNAGRGPSSGQACDQEGAVPLAPACAVGRGRSEAAFGRHAFTREPVQSGSPARRPSDDDFPHDADDAEGQESRAQGRDGSAVRGPEPRTRGFRDDSRCHPGGSAARSGRSGHRGGRADPPRGEADRPGAAGTFRSRRRSRLETDPRAEAGLA